eukprot:scaffold3680_cov381-Prasinococcus_capsulatus_cf.AAC.1
MPRMARPAPSHAGARSPELALAPSRGRPRMPPRAPGHACAARGGRPSHSPPPIQAAPRPR